MAPPAAAEPRSRAPLYVLAAAALLGGGYLLGKVGDEPKPEVSSAPTTQVPPRPAETVAPRTEAPAVVQAAPTATPTEPAPTASSGSSAEPAATATEAPTGTGTATSTGPLPTGAATAAESPTAATAAAPTATASSTGAPPASAVPAETASAAPVTPPPSEAPPFDKAAASAALSSAAGAASGCKQEGDPSGSARVQVTFVPSGRVTSANVQGPPFAGTATGGCIARAFRSASVPPFSGDPVTVSKTVTIP